MLVRGLAGILAIVAQVHRWLGVALLFLKVVSWAEADLPAKVSVGDQISIGVIGSTEFNGTFIVTTDGSISGLGFGRIVVRGKTLDQVQATVTERLRRLVRDPQVYAWFTAQTEGFVHVVGLPGHPGRVPYAQAMDLARVLVGFTPDADADQLSGVVFRDGRELARVSIVDVLRGAPGVFRGPMRPSDVIVVSRRPVVRVWMSANFRRPGQLALPVGSTLAQAVAEAGGFAGTDPFGLQVAPDEPTAQAALKVRRGEAVHEFRSQQSDDAQSFVLESGDTVWLDVPAAVTVTVMGEVMRPGSQRTRDRANVVSVLGSAGGATASGTLARVYVFRGSDVLQWDLTPSKRGVIMPEWTLQDQDIVLVPRNERLIYVLGEVHGPGSFPMDDLRQTRASDALALARGTTRSGSLRRVVLMRADASGVFRPTVFNLDEFLKDGRLESNPELQSGDILLFGQPDGLTLDALTRVVSSALLLERLWGQ